MGRKTKKQRERKQQAPINPATHKVTVEGTATGTYRRPPGEPASGAHVRLFGGGGGSGGRDGKVGATFVPALELDATYHRWPDMNVGERWVPPKVPPSSGNPRSAPGQDPSFVEAMRKLTEMFGTKVQQRKANENPSDVKASQVQAEASYRRLTSLMNLLTKNPIKIIDQFKQMGIPFELMQNVPGMPLYDTIVIKVTDLDEADNKIAARGNLYDQLYKGDI